MNIILVSGATARARTLSVDWRHWTAGGFGLLALFLSFTLLFNYVTLRYAASINHPLLQAIVLADQREEAQKTQEVVQGHLNAMALTLGDLQAQDAAARWTGRAAGEARGAQAAGPARRASAGTTPGRGGPAPTFRRSLSLDEFNAMLGATRAAGRSALRPAGRARGPAGADSANKKFLPTLKPIEMAWYSSNFGYRIDPFTGAAGFHEGIDFPADAGTPIVAAASGKVIVAECHPQYGKMIEIDHGNGLVSRYAHCRELLVKEGDLVIRGQLIGAGRHDRTVDRPAPAFRGAAERRAAESGAFSAGQRLKVVRRHSPADAKVGRAEHGRGEAVLTPCFLGAPCPWC